MKILILALGANDGLRGVEVTRVQSNLSVIIEDAQRRGIAVVLVGMDTLPLRGWGYAIAFHRIYEDLAAKYHVPLVPFVLMKLMSDPSLMQSDRAHPNKKWSPHDRGHDLATAGAPPENGRVIRRSCRE